ncbi:hypothetical protein ABFS82_14G012400 [Erythranthe guttata]
MILHKSITPRKTQTPYPPPPPYPPATHPRLKNLTSSYHHHLTSLHKPQTTQNFLTPITLLPSPIFSVASQKSQEMQHNPPTPPSQFSISEAAAAAAAAPPPPQIPADEPTFSSLFDWSDFLDFNIDETLTAPIPHPELEPPPIDQSQPSDSSGPDKSERIRKRDPRLTCSNFLAGIVPCACPELDALLAEEEAVLPGKKRTRTARNPGLNPTRCQVPDCEADISELKGYHRRHRVCLKCANSSMVVLDGESKRYCQQCGKFHILSDFDEGKRSCRRKLERHNNRRRRKPNDSKEGTEKESQQILLADDVSGDDDTAKDGICVSSQIEEREILPESNAHVSTVGSGLDSQNLQSDSVASFSTPADTHIEGDKDKQNPKYKLSPSYCDNKTNFSSLCPSGRISFKLYDWNPAEFPRRLRHQIFEWLANMPVELEGYIRPGCTILTAFIAMPKPEWLKLLEEPALCLKDLVASPGSMLSGRDTMHVYLNDMIFRVTKDANSVVKVKVKSQAPKLHYIYPTCFEAGRPMEFVACGSFLLQPNFRFLISFAGRYLAYSFSISPPNCEKDAKGTNYQMLKIRVPEIDVALFGPAFIEVENESGLSNFIPILVGDKETCEEMSILQQKFDTKREISHPQLACQDFALRQDQFSEFLLDVAWLLKKPVSDQQLTSSHIQRFNHVFDFLIEKESSIILQRVYSSVRSALDNDLAPCISDSEMSSLQKNMEIAQRRLSHNLLEKKFSTMPNSESTSQIDDIYVAPATNMGVQRMVKNMMGMKVPTSPSIEEGATVPLLKREVIMTVDLQERPMKPGHGFLTRRFLTSRSLIVAVMAVAICFGVCSVVLHPQKVDRIATTIRSCLFDNS